MLCSSIIWLVWIGAFILIRFTLVYKCLFASRRYVCHTRFLEKVLCSRYFLFVPLERYSLIHSFIPKQSLIEYDKVFSFHERLPTNVPSFNERIEVVSTRTNTIGKCECECEYPTALPSRGQWIPISTVTNNCSTDWRPPLVGLVCAWNVEIHRVFELRELYLKLEGTV